MEPYVEKALSAFFSSPTSSKPMPTLDVFKEASRSGRSRRKRGLTDYRKSQKMMLHDIFDQIPVDRISDAARRFAMKMLELNRNAFLSWRCEMKILYLAWQDPQSRQWFPVGKLSVEGGIYRFVYTKGACFRKLYSFGFHAESCMKSIDLGICFHCSPIVSFPRSDRNIGISCVG